jgi:hypothetical protein
MAILIEMQYGKKLGLPEYSSHNFSVSLKAEVARLEDVPSEVERVYQILQTSVDGQIVNAGYVPGKEPAVPARNNGNADNKPWKCSDKQRALIVKIVDEGKLDRVEVEQLAVNRFGHGVALLNKLEASGLIDELLGKTGRPSERQAGTVRTFPQRRAA